MPVAGFQRSCEDSPGMKREENGFRLLRRTKVHAFDYRLCAFLLSLLLSSLAFGLWGDALYRVYRDVGRSARPHSLPLVRLCLHSLNQLIELSRPARFNPTS